MTLTPLTSIIMPSFNQADFIEASIDSVLTQDYPHLELIVADGRSTDRTIEILTKKQQNDSRLRWFSCADKGPADALNKGFNQARGTYFGWLNSDDLYTEGAIQRVMDAFESYTDWMMIYGHGQHIDAWGNTLDAYPTKTPDTPIETFKSSCFICQPTMFFKRTVWLLLGDLDLSLKTAFDFDYWLRAFQQFPERIGFIDKVQAYSRLHEDCITRNLRRDVAIEGMRLLATHLGDAPGHWLLTYINELKTMPSGQLGVDATNQHIKDTFREVVDYMSVDESGRVRAAIDALMYQETTDIAN